MVTEADFQRARIEPVYRQEFLDSIDLGEYTQYVGRVVDRPDHFELHPSAIMSAIPPSKRAHLPIIYVHPPAYSYTTYHDFLATLKYHEGRHAMQFCKTHNGILPGIHEYVRRKLSQETDAFHNELMNMHKLSHTPEYRNDVLRQWETNLIALDVLDETGSIGLWFMNLPLLGFSWKVKKRLSRANP